MVITETYVLLAISRETPLNNLLNKFLNIQPSQDFGRQIFEVLKEFIPFTSGYIYFDEPRRLEYSYNPTEDTKQKILKENLKIKNTNFGEIIISSENFTKEHKKTFQTCAILIANIIKDYELTKIMKMQAEALQKSYQEIKDNNKKLKESEEIKSKFLSHVSHELRTPLNSILGYSDLLTNEFIGKLNNKQKEYLNDIKISGLHLLGMINEVLDMSKIEAGAMQLNLQEFSIELIINEAINTIKPLALKKDIQIKTSLQDFKIKADYQKLQQILFNLLSNAIKFTPPNGVIKIKATQTKTHTIISIEDNGIGISQENLDKIFDKFEQFTNSNEASTGLGLTITKELAKLHNGEISVNSEVNKGSKFTLSIPIEI